MVLLQSEDGAEFVVSAHDASQSMAIDRKIRLDSARRITPSDDGAADETEYAPICLPIQGSILSKVLQYWKKHAAASPSSGGDHDRDLSGWDAKFIEDLDHDTHCDLVLAAHYLCNQGLLHLTCQSVAKTIKGKSSHEICNICSIKSNVDQDRPLTREQNALKALHVVRCQEFTAYDFRRRDFICTCFCHANIAFFDLDEECEYIQLRLLAGRHLTVLSGSILDRGLQSSVNIISLKIAGSEVGYPFTVFGTLIARDQVDYKCLYPSVQA